MLERERPKLAWKHVLRGEDRLRMAATIYELRVNRELPWKEIEALTGVPLTKACNIHKQYDKSEFEMYLKENDDV